jgi:hypothetical protein
VLHPAFLRGALLWFASERLFRPCWTTQILDEWRGSLLRRFADDEGIAGKVDRQRSTMLEQFPEAMIEGHEFLIERLKLPDQNDRHVLAAAIRSHAGVIVTYNLKDFPADVLGRFGIEAQHPDEFIGHLMDLDRAAVCASVRRQRAGLKNPTVTPEELLERYLSMGLAGTVAALESMIDLI